MLVVGNDEQFALQVVYVCVVVVATFARPFGVVASWALGDTLHALRGCCVWVLGDFLSLPLLGLGRPLGLSCAVSVMIFCWAVGISGPGCFAPL